MFARSPIRPLQQHMEKAQYCAEMLLPYFDAVLQDDWNKVHELQQEISRNEREADHLKTDFRLHLPKGLFLPVPRTDLLELLSKQEYIANKSKDIAGIILGRKMKIPNQIANQFRNYLERSIDASRQAKKAIDELDELMESGFRGKEVELVEEMIGELDKIEHDTDQMQIKLRQDLFNIEKSLEPIEVMFLYKIIEEIGVLADVSQEAGGRLRMLTAN
ncbi:MAG: TIGR00153 family protein [Coxiellaceae bacterium]|nr:TIGR00153 family protein [Coxiellaceae bacterium]